MGYARLSDRKADIFANLEEEREANEELKQAIAGLEETIMSLRDQLQEQAEAKADEAFEKTFKHDEKVFDKVNKRLNEYGEILNCRVAEDCERISLPIAAKALRTTLAPRHSEPRKDKSGRTWIDFYPSVSTATGDIA